jgi:hypothetical protein
MEKLPRCLIEFVSTCQAPKIGNIIPQNSAAMRTFVDVSVLPVREIVLANFPWEIMSLPGERREKIPAL